MFNRNILKDAFPIWLVVGICLSLVTGGTANAQEIKVPYIKDTEKTLRLAHGLTPGSPYDMGANRFAELVEMYSRGAIKVKIFPSAQLGKEQDTAKDVQLGTLDMTLVAINNASMWYKPLDVFIMPLISFGRRCDDWLGELIILTHTLRQNISA